MSLAKDKDKDQIDQDALAAEWGLALEADAVVANAGTAGDDAEGTSAPIIRSTNAMQDASQNNAKPQRQSFKLPDGYSMVWLNAGPIEAKAPLDLQFALLDPGLTLSEANFFVG